MRKIIYLLIIISLTALYGCHKEHSIPSKYVYSKDSLKIFPDYKNIIIPANIAPMNFQIIGDAKEVLAEVCAGDINLVITANSRNEIIFEEKVWKQLIKNEHGKGINIHIFTKGEKEWIRYEDFKMDVASPIDRYLSYRLIEPGYELYRQMGLYQRDLESFEVKTIYENNQVQNTENNHCVNCHNFQNYSTDRMLFHVRSAHGGTVIYNKGKIEKMNLKNDSILGPAVYPTWHPKMNRIVFSSNMTGQSFHMLSKEKVEVVDSESDLIYYDADRKSIRNIFKTKSCLETFPCWNPEGNKLYYSAAYLPQLDTISDKQAYAFFLNHFKEIKYDIMSIDFDPEKEIFSNPQVVVNCSAEEKSAVVPRVSPKGDFLLYTKGDYGQFHIWHKSADLWVKNLRTGEEYALAEANSNDVDSYHSWSSNGKWIAFSSRRDDGNFTRIYLTYFDRKGQAHKAFMIPQERPSDNTLLLKSYNVPELTKEALKCDENAFRQVIYNKDAQNVQYSNR